MTQQLPLFSHVTDAFADCPTLSTRELYREVARRADIAPAELDARVPVGDSRQPHNLIKRQIRWHQQTLKQMGVLERVEGRRGVWRLTREGHKKLDLRRISPGYVMVAYSTRLGVALWADCRTAFANLDRPISVCVTSPPYPLRKARAYGNPTDEQAYVDFVCAALEPIVAHLKPGGSIVLNLGNDIFLPGLPARSLYRERLILALADRFGLFKMDSLPWINLSKAPGPVVWASKTRQQLNVAWEDVVWLTNDPLNVDADNRRVLQPHTERHKRLVARGGEPRSAAYSDGAYRVRPGAFGTRTAGRIPRNVFIRGHQCADQLAYKRAARALGLPPHGAPFPLDLAKFLITFLSSPGDLVVDIFGGSGSTAKAAELLGREWILTDVIWEYLRGGAERFREADGFALAPGFLEVAA